LLKMTVVEAWVNVFEELSQVLYDFFVGNDSTYAEQKDDGNYSTVYKTVTPKLLNDMLKNKGSYLSYQFKDQTAKWICIDFDIAQRYRDSTDFDQKKDVYFKDLLLKVRRVSVGVFRKSRHPYLDNF
jgi:hypothetical protein